MDHTLPISDTFEKLGIALALGLLVGMQRQRTDSRFAGIRTFPLVTVLGTMTGLLALAFSGWILAAGFICLGVLMLIGNQGKSDSPPDPGITTEVALLLMFAVGAYLVSGHAGVAVPLVGTIAVLLHLKPEMHAFARKVGEKDFKAVMQFVLIALVILPVLPDGDYGPYQALNPRKLWLMVVLIVGISLGGYVAYKVLGAKTGGILAGILGGLISSTATTVSCARRTREAPESSPIAAQVIMIASTVVFARVLVLAGVAAPHLLKDVAGPIGTMLGVMTLIAGGVWLFTRGETSSMPEPENPSELKPALVFGALFALVLLGVAAAKERFGTEGLYAVAVLSGLTDMDAITLSAVQMDRAQAMSVSVVWRMILVASLANLVFKLGVVAVLGSRRLLARLAGLFGIASVAGLLILCLWPGGEAVRPPESVPSGTKAIETVK